MAGNTVRLHRIIATRPGKVYRAFLDADAMAALAATQWLRPVYVYELEARVGGRFRMAFTNFGTGNGHSFGGEYLELVPDRKLRYTDRFDDPNLPRRDHRHGEFEGRGGRYRDPHRAGRHSRGDSGGGMLPGLAAIPRQTPAPGRAGNSRLSARAVRRGSILRRAHPLQQQRAFALVLRQTRGALELGAGPASRRPSFASRSPCTAGNKW